MRITRTEPAFIRVNSHFKAIKDITKLPHQRSGLGPLVKRTFGHIQPPNKDLTTVPGLNVHHTKRLRLPGKQVFASQVTESLARDFTAHIGDK